MQEEEKQNGSSGTPSEQPKKHKKEKGKSLIETMREIDAKEAQKEAEAEERRQEILAEREKKEKEAYAKKNPAGPHRIDAAKTGHHYRERHHL